MLRAVLAVWLAARAAPWGAAARELDPAACAARFDVQHDKIIRTEESREMGARYLSELDVGSRHECRRLCCETDACDVFVYEEKSPGSCYLFVCGPPEDFRCKFTAHGNFSSGVLALSRRLAELQDQERLGPPAPPAAPPAAPAMVRTTAAAPPPAPPPPKPLATAPAPAPPPIVAQHTTLQPKKSRCSRYQWECHSGGECIAVYNACDGVPQCADGSDEAPELGCPAAPAPPAAPAHSARRPAFPTSPSPSPPPPIYPVQMYDQGGGGEESRVLEGMRAGAAGGESRWPHRLLQAQPHRYPAAESVVPVLGVGDSGPHIFSHKGGLVQEQAFEPPAAPPAWPRHPAHHALGMESGWGGWGEWGEERHGWPAAPAPPAPPPRPRPPPAPQEQLQMSEFPGAGYGAAAARPMPELPLGYGPAPDAAPHDGPKKGPPPAPPAPVAAAGPPAPPSTPLDNGTKKKAAAVHSESVESSASSSRSEAHAPPAGAGAREGAAVAGGERGAGSAGAAAAVQRDEHDGLSERPPAAIMLLVLGVCMTGVLGVLAGSRVRTARRLRLRRGKLAHDADYLVNGMYL